MGRSIAILIICIFLSSCSITVSQPQNPLGGVPSKSVNTPYPHPTKTHPQNTEPRPATHTLDGVDAAYQIVQNSSFNNGTNPWHARIGNLSRTTSEHYTAPGAGRIITSGMDDVGVAGQCVSIQEKLTARPINSGQKLITFDVFLKTDTNAATVSLIIIFHQADCSQPGQLHVQVGTLQSSPLPGSQHWTQLSASGTIPTDAISADILFWAVGKYDTAQVYFDDVRSHPQPQE